MVIEFMKKMLRLLALRFQKEYFLVGLPLLFVLHGYTDHYGDIPGKDVLLLALEYVGYALVFSMLFALFFRSFRKGAVFSFGLFCFYFFFGAAHDALKEVLGKSFLVGYSFILPTAFLAFLALFFYVKKSKRSFQNLTCYLNIVLLVLLVVDVVLLTMKPAIAQSKPAKINVAAPVPEVQHSSNNSVHHPDIHLIIADEYAGRTALQEVFGFDNTPFEDSLRRRGFYVADSSRSNYNYTVTSMASLFQMDYVPDLKDESTEEIYRVSKALINRNRFIDTLQEKGYTIRNFSVFDFAGQPPFEEPYFPQKLRLITDHTFWGRVKNDIGYHAALTFKVRSELDKVEASLRHELEAGNRKMSAVLEESAVAYQSPRFFYTHLMMPHDPYLADKEGNLMRLDALLDPDRQRDEKELYLGYLQYCNQQLLFFIDRLLKTSIRPPVILLMSDHGYRRAGAPVAYHFSNLNAVYYPVKNYEGYYSGLSNVNQLRLLLNKQFSGQWPLLKDTAIYLGSIKEIKERL
jgi:hypothetical protein